ncbi:M12 family metallo-peptidase [Lutibacter sp. A64]|uniref:reprolysin-like metallopeptidase n=1 Tax=Lutibacter sp. A64 TaxID=2918526 RepID=UPI001F0686B0|nr:zinc-dependent metalloprotease family protein [Lutibacter sp. A64]UMB53183.1 M12 family metallo-peptidase [Lutibacter sp. A64]
MKYLNIRFLLVFIIITAQYFSASAQKSGNLWFKNANSEKSSAPKLMRKSIPKAYTVYDLDLETLKDRLKDAPKRKEGLKNSSVILNFPNGNGELEKYEIFETPILAENLQKKYPTIKSYIGKSIKNPGVTIRFSVTAAGLNAMTLKKSGESTFIDPYTKNKASYLVYKKTDSPEPEEAFVCKFDDYNTEIKPKTKITSNTSAKEANANDGKLRTYRLAVATTGEYSQFHLTQQGVAATETDSIKKVAVLSAIVTTMTRVNGIFERDVALTMVLVDNNTNIIFLDAATDGFTNDDSEELIDESQKIISSTIGTDNFDIGHTFSTGGGGLAQLSSPCTSYGKASGITGSSNPIGDAYDIDYVAHEMGHQYGAHHTFNASSGNCDGNINSGTAVEPGSGSTIMAYAGLCSPHNIQNYGDAYFHYVSIQEMWANITEGNSSACAEITDTDNNTPVIESLQNYTIPVSTPFVLSATASDVDGDLLTYTWEQIDTETAAHPLVSTSTEGPAFRSLEPSESPERTFPNMSTILGGNTYNQWEVLPSVSRSMTFAVTVRDNNKSGGQTASDITEITFSDKAKAFKLTSQTTQESWDAGTSQTINWDVANTDSAPVNCSYVNILFSNDGGLTYPITLASNVLNNGTHTIVSPDVTTTTGRIKIESVGNIFFNVNVANISVQSSEFIMEFDEFKLETCAPDDVIYNMTYNTFLDFNEETTFSATDLPEGANVTFNPATATANNTAVTMKITGMDTDNLGLHTITVTGTSASVTKSTVVELNVYSSEITAPVLNFPENESTGVLEPYNLSWNDNENIKDYTIEIALDSLFTTIVETDTLNSAYFKPELLEFNTTYYWRVKGANSCSESSFSTYYSFTTANVVCDSNTSTNKPLNIPDNNTTGVNSNISITTNKIITDVNVTVTAPHEWVGDLSLYLISPLGTKVLLSANNGNEGLNYTNTFFDDDAEASITSGIPPFSGTFKPQGKLSDFNDEESYGDWTLQAIDNGPADTGTIDSWSIEICGVAVIGDDDDKDGVKNEDDICPETPLGSAVDSTGCPVFSLPVDNFTIETISETCPDKNNGQILISANETYTYKVTLNGVEATLQNTDLSPGSYTICIGVEEDEDYEQCYDVVIDEGTTISGKVAVNSGKASIEIEEGTGPFMVFVNDKIVLETVAPIFTFDVKHGDKVEIKSSVSCEGVFAKTINLFDEIIAYPNPTKGNLEIALPVSVNTVKIEVYNIQSQLISVQNYTVTNNKVQLNIANNATGLYFAKVYLEEPIVLKIIKE